MDKLKYKIAFICVHNSCRSQMAEAITRLFASDIFEPYSAGTEISGSINQEAVATIRELYGVDMNATQRSKSLSELPDVDMVVTMGCGVACPALYAPYRTDWGLEDPTGKSHDEYIKCARTIENKVMELRAEMLAAGEVSDNPSNAD